MDDLIHKFYCGLCRIDIMGASVARLCVNVIEHNNKFHIHAYNQWSIEEMRSSPMYKSPSMPQPQYTQPYALTTQWEWGTAAQPPDITREDLEFLAELKVIWHTQKESRVS